ncbi:NADP-dependent oxidoreductase [Pseudonocardia sp. EV170527-09]|uniref:NADP-dependent oxidoreductase n=1 Tax=Pseudonocardia sp. EV170527-09 TaxID=2603411 RepID=UPI0011F31C4C|nr:NADP-dependent oxidoreductase [Pseudonocardia sp. EV170527-09]KAA1034982.1 NADP-dependent oxidoreductase [Pseudonocardia sp. EV170527-09]
MRALQFHKFGSPDVIVLAEVARPEPGPGRIRISVQACGLTPADWHLADGLLADVLPVLPRGLGLEVAGTVDALGPGVHDVRIGDRVFGPACFDGPTAGAAQYALMPAWAPVPEGVTAEQAAALPVAAETAWRALDDLGVRTGELLLVHGAGTTVGETAVRLARHRGLRVVATAGPTRTAALEQVGARVTPYGEGMVARVRRLAGGPVDRALDATPTGGRIDRADRPSPAGGSLPALIELTGVADRVLTVSDFAAASELGVRTSTAMRYDRMDGIARLAGEGVLAVPVAGTYTFDRVQEAASLSLSRRTGGKLVLVP